MSDNFMGGGLAAPEAPEVAPATGRNPKVLIGGGIGLALVAVIGGYLLIGGGGGSESPAAGAVKPAVPHAAPTTPGASTAPAAKATAAIRTFNGAVGRDPFNPLITAPPTKPAVTAQPVTSGTSPAAATGSTTPGPVISGLPGTGVTVLPTSIPVVPTGTPAPTTSAASVVVVLKAIAFHGTTPYVVVSFAGKSIALKTGDTSADNLKVVAIAPDDGTATFQLGDQTFDLHIGQSYVD